MEKLLETQAESDNYVHESISLPAISLGSAWNKPRPQACNAPLLSCRRRKLTSDFSNVVLVLTNNNAADLSFMTRFS